MVTDLLHTLSAVLVLFIPMAFAWFVIARGVRRQAQRARRARQRRADASMR